jgi:cysteamine dioxygenase
MWNRFMFNLFRSKAGEMSPFENVFRLAVQTFDRPLQGQKLDCTRLAKMCCQLKAEHVPFSQERFEPVYSTARVTGGYLSLLENKKISMGIFSVRAGARLPLHDHQDMHGLLRVLTGNIEIQSYSLFSTPPTSPDPALLAQLPGNVRPDKLLCALAHEPYVLSADKPEVALLAPHERNLHEIRAIPSDAGLGAAFLDILSPPYGNERDCNYFRLIGTQHCEQMNQKIAWLLPLDNAPNDFATVTLPYHGPPLKS